MHGQRQALRYQTRASASGAIRPSVAREAGMERRTVFPTLRRSDHRLARVPAPTLSAIEREKSRDNVKPLGIKHGRRPGVPSGPAWRGARQRKAGEQMGKVHGNCSFVFSFE